MAADVPGSNLPALGRQPERQNGQQPEQLALMPSPRRLFTATPSRLANFDCPRRYWMTYVQRPRPPKGPPWAHNTLGAAVHLALARWWQLPAANRSPESGAGLLGRHWQDDGFCDAEQSATWRSRAADWIAGYLRDEQQRRPQAEEPVGVERTVALRTDTLAISGRVDRIDDRDGEVVIVDYKTGRSRLGTDDARSSLALALYALAAERTLRKRCRLVELHHLPTGEIARFEHTEQSLQRHLDRAGQTATDIQAALDTVAGGADPAEVFEPNPGPGCSWCDFRKYCPEGQQASTARHSWDALAVE
jgi:putative RecB family exonuclease